MSDELGFLFYRRDVAFVRFVEKFYFGGVDE